MARHVEINQNNKYVISLQYHKKEVSDEVDFLHADKHENLLQIERDGQAFPKFPKKQVCNVFTIYQKKG